MWRRECAPDLLRPKATAGLAEGWKQTDGLSGLSRTAFAIAWDSDRGQHLLQYPVHGRVIGKATATCVSVVGGKEQSAGKEVLT